MGVLEVSMCTRSNVQKKINVFASASQLYAVVIALDTCLVLPRTGTPYLTSIEISLRLSCDSVPYFSFTIVLFWWKNNCKKVYRGGTKKVFWSNFQCKKFSP